MTTLDIIFFRVLLNTGLVPFVHYILNILIEYVTWFLNGFVYIERSN